MSQLTFKKQSWLTPIQLLSGAVDKRQLIPILSNFLIQTRDRQLYLTATDLEIELTVTLKLDTQFEEQPFTLPAKKFLDVLKNLGEDETFDLNVHEHHVIIVTSSAKFKFFTLPANDFPMIHRREASAELMIPRVALAHLMQCTAFAISQQDVRVFLNGLLLEFQPNQIVAVAADGHRMAVAMFPYTHSVPYTRLILPKRSVSELLRLMNSMPEEEELKLTLYSHLFGVQIGSYRFTSKLIDAQFIPYHQAIPKQFKTVMLIEREVLKRALTRTLIISIEKSKPVVFDISSDQLSLLAQNQEQEHVLETVAAVIEGLPLRIGINPYYLLDVLSIFSEETVRLSFLSPDNSILVQMVNNEQYYYILMPMKL